jgi:hypothetical protein
MTNQSAWRYPGFQDAGGTIPGSILWGNVKKCTGMILYDMYFKQFTMEKLGIQHDPIISIHIYCNPGISIINSKSMSIYHIHPSG